MSGNQHFPFDTFESGHNFHGRILKIIQEVLNTEYPTDAWPDAGGHTIVRPFSLKGLLNTSMNDFVYRHSRLFVRVRLPSPGADNFELTGSSLFCH